MLKKVLKTAAAVSAIAVLFASCSHNPAQVSTTGKNNLSATALMDGTPMHAKKIASSTGAAVHIIAADGYVYKYQAGLGWVRYSQKPSGTLISIAIPYNGSLVYVLTETSPTSRSIWSHQMSVPTGAWQSVTATPQGAFPVDIACGGYWQGPGQVLWKLGRTGTNPNYTYKIYYYQGPTKPWQLYIDAPIERPEDNETGPILPAPSDRLLVDPYGCALTRLAVTCGACDGSFGHVAFGYGHGYDHNNNPYNTDDPENYVNPALDIYGIAPASTGNRAGVSLNDYTLSFAAHNPNSDSWTLFKVAWGETRTPVGLSRFGKTYEECCPQYKLHHVHEVTCSGATNNNLWIIASFRVDAALDTVVWRYVPSSDDYGWEIP